MLTINVMLQSGDGDAFQFMSFQHHTPHQNYENNYYLLLFNSSTVLAERFNKVNE